MFAFAYSLFNALAAIPAILSFVEAFASGVTAWLITRSKNETLSQIANAAAAASRATNQEERHKALDLWREALKRDRIIK